MPSWRPDFEVIGLEANQGVKLNKMRGKWSRFIVKLYDTENSYKIAANKFGSLSSSSSEMMRQSESSMTSGV